MSSLAKLKKRVPEVIAEYFQLLRLAEEAREREVNAAVCIQAAARGFLIRRRLAKLRAVATVIQKCWRGYLGRERFKLRLEDHNRMLRRAYFDAKATVIQRHWRGFWSRKNIHDFYARKRYLQYVRERNEQIKNELNDEAERAFMTQRQMAEETARRLFDEKISKLHHLVSTAAQPGIFNSPYSVATGTIPIVAGLPVEDHLKTSIKSQVKSKLPPLKGSALKALAPAGPELIFNGEKIHKRITLRQFPPYDLVHQEQVLEQKVNRSEMLTQHPIPFMSTLHNPVSPTMGIQANRNLEQYHDPFDPTVGNKTERFTPPQQKVSTNRFGRYVKKEAFFDKQLNTEAY